ncbi:hypothetical protein HPP92_001922 [Vanilla planifolia]|uniref:Uncharacterized protein n=1 Tax=Vanilla planifolia TaxID=51239 RepID=A0A835VLV2_VANPL|nr:hypothetical protein HPP92_001922 [Vanilla planifolia]
MARDHSHFQDPNDALNESQEPSLPLPPFPPPHRPKKQGRRRLQTGRPYQERLLNMAEARREIVTALKFHRAAMKQATEQHKQEDQLLQKPTPPPPIPQASTQSEDLKNDLVVDSFITPIVCPFSQFSHCSPSWICPQITPIPLYDTLNLPLPDQPLGLSLNYQAFPNIATSLVSNSSKTHFPQPPLVPSPPHSTSSQSSSESFLSPVTVSLEARPNPPDPTLHPAMGDEEMAEIRLISEKHDVEWNDEVNWMTAARWSKFLTTVEAGAGENGEGVAYQMHGEVVDNHNEDHLQDACLLWSIWFQKSFPKD